MLGSRAAPTAPQTRGHAHDLPPLPRQRLAAASSTATSANIAGAGDRWARPPATGDGDMDRARRSAAGVLDSAEARHDATAAAGRDCGASAVPTDGFQTALGARQKKRQRQQAARRAAGAAQRQAQHGQGDDQRAELDGDAMDVSSDDSSPPEVIPPPFQEPPLTRLHLVSHVANIQRKVDELEARQAPRLLREKAKKRLEDTQQMLRQAGGATEKRMLFSIMAEEDKIRRLITASQRNLEAIAAAEAEREKLDKRTANLQVGSNVIARKLENSRQRRAYLSAQNAAEAIPPETTTTVHQALERILLSVGPSLVGEASTLAEYFKRVAPIPARDPGENQDADLSECDTFLDPEEDFPPEGDGGDAGRASSSGDGTAPPAARRTAGGRRSAAACSPLLPDRMPEDVRAAAQLVEDIRRQRMQAVEATYEKKAVQDSELPALSGPQVVDRFDTVLKIAIDHLEGIRNRDEHLAPPQVPPPPANLCHAAHPPPPHAHHEPPSKLQRQGERRRTRWEVDAGNDAPPIALPVHMPMVDLCPGCGTGPLPEAALVGCCVCCAAVCGDCSKGGLEEVNSCLYCHDVDQRDKRGACRRRAEPSDPMEVSEPRSPRPPSPHAPQQEPREQLGQDAAALALPAPGEHGAVPPLAASASPTAEQMLEEQLAAHQQGQQRSQAALAHSATMDEEL